MDLHLLKREGAELQSYQNQLIIDVLIYDLFKTILAFVHADNEEEILSRI